MAKDCTGTTGPDFPDTENTEQPGCTTTPSGATSCPTVNQNPACRPFQLSKSNDVCFIDGTSNEALGIGGADLNIYKLLGVHEQGKLIDVTGKGSPTSGGNLAGFPASNAFNMFVSEWRSLQAGTTNITASSFIGYDFGSIKTNDGSRDLYGVDTSIRKHIMAFAIKQSSVATQRVTKARLERSENGTKWYGVQVVTLPNDDCLNTILSKSSVPSRYWRLRPLDFTGSSSDSWGVSAFQLFHDYDPTHVSNIQDKILLENRDRDYDQEPSVVKGFYDHVEIVSDLTRFGLAPTLQLFYTVNFSAVVAALGRPIIIGDIIQVPSQTQYSADLEPIEKWMEVTETGWSVEGFSPGWVPTLMIISLQPALASQETQDLFGDLAENDLAGELGLQDKGDGKHPIFQDYSDASQTVEAEAADAVPQRGAESSGTIRAWESEEIESAASQGVCNLQTIGQNNVGFQTEDAMPPNNKPFSEGDAFPATPTNGDYHRLVYIGTASQVPARLFRYSQSKGRWIFLEKDRRGQNDSAHPVLQEFLTSQNAVPHDEITRKDDC